MKIGERCPRCGGPLNHERPALNSLSRVDNQTAICNACGTAEAMWEYHNQGRPLPPVDRYLGRDEISERMESVVREGRPTCEGMADPTYLDRKDSS